MTWRAVAVTACCLGSATIGLAAGLAWSPVKDESAIHAKLGSLKQCRHDLAQLTDWKNGKEGARLLLVLSRFEEARADQIRMVADYSQCRAGLQLLAHRSGETSP